MPEIKTSFSQIRRTFIAAFFTILMAPSIASADNLSGLGVQVNLSILFLFTVFLGIISLLKYLIKRRNLGRIFLTVLSLIQLLLLLFFTSIFPPEKGLVGTALIFSIPGFIELAVAIGLAAKKDSE